MGLIARKIIAYQKNIDPSTKDVIVEEIALDFEEYPAANTSSTPLTTQQTPHNSLYSQNTLTCESRVTTKNNGSAHGRSNQFDHPCVELYKLCFGDVLCIFNILDALLFEPVRPSVGRILQAI